MKTILGIDVGSVWAWQFFDGNFAESREEKGGLYDYGNKIRELLNIYRPKVVVTAKPTRFYNVIVAQSKRLGILEYFCKKNDIEYIEYIDSHCKKSVFGSGRKNKQEIEEHFGETSEHIADAKMFISTYINEN